MIIIKQWSNRKTMESPNKLSFKSKHSKDTFEKVGSLCVLDGKSLPTMSAIEFI